MIEASAGDSRANSRRSRTVSRASLRPHAAAPISTAPRMKGSATAGTLANRRLVMNSESSVIPTGNPKTDCSGIEASGSSQAEIRRPDPAAMSPNTSASGIARNAAPAPSIPLQLLDDELRVGVDADARGNLEGLFDDFLWGQLRMFDQGPGCGDGKRSTRTDARHPVVRFDDVALPGDEERPFFVRDEEQRLEASEEAVGAPFFCQLDRGPADIALGLFEHSLELLQQGHRVGRSSREPSQHLSLIKPAQLDGVMFHDGGAQGDLPIATDRD